MAKISKFVKLNKDILLEYIYNDGNLISEPYNILVNSKDKKRSYFSTDTTSTNNDKTNQLFRLDPIESKWGKVDTDSYTFLQEKNYTAPSPIKHDTIKIHLPINWTFGQYLGFYIRVYGFDTLNQKEYELSNFYFDMTDVEQQYLLNFSSPPLLFQEKLWGKNITVDIPALSALSGQLTNNQPTQNSINSLLTEGVGFNMNSPVFIDFQFINRTQTINQVKTYLLEGAVTSSIPQTPEFERLGLKIENSVNGDFFEIYGTYNGTIAEFKKFIDDAVLSGNRYYVQYNITMYEQNIRGKTTTINLTDNFNEPVEYRPIIKYSTTTAIIDVEMRLIDSVDGSYIIRRSSYGMLQDEVSKYSLKMTKINVSNANKPKVYNIKSSINPELVGVANSFGVIPVNTNTKPVPNTRTSINGMNTQGGSNVVVEQVKVPFPVLVDRFNIMAKSENSVLDSKRFYGFGKIQILLYPFDNIVNFTIASGTNEKPNYLDMTGYSEIKFIIKNDKNTISFTPYVESGEIDLANGVVSFKISQGKFSEIKKIFNTGVNVFYITGTNSSTTSVIYTGLYKIYDDVNNVGDLNDDVDDANNNGDTGNDGGDDGTNENGDGRQTAIVTRRVVTEDNRPIKKTTTRRTQSGDDRPNRTEFRNPDDDIFNQ
jgi:hypothetical protein